MSDQQQALEKATTREVADRGFEGATVTSVSLRFDEDITEDRATEIVSLLGRIDRSAKWWLGDWMLEAEKRFGEHFALQQGLQTGYSERSLYNWRDVTLAIPVEERSEVIDFSSHIEMIPLWKASPEKFRELRDELERERLSGKARGNKEVRQAVKTVLEDIGAPVRLFDMPTTAEELAETAIELTRVRTELEDLRLATGKDVRCPRCRQIWPAEDAATPPDITA